MPSDIDAISRRAACIPTALHLWLTAQSVPASRAEVKQLYTPPVEESVTQLRTTVAGFSGLELGKPDRVYVSLHASSQPGAQLLPSADAVMHSVTQESTLLAEQLDCQTSRAVSYCLTKHDAHPDCRGPRRVDVAGGLRHERRGGHGAR